MMRRRGDCYGLVGGLNGRWRLGGWILSSVGAITIN